MKWQPYAKLTQGRTDDVLAVEQKVLELLKGCPVPRILGIDHEMSSIFFEHKGSNTLDDVCRHSDMLQRRQLGTNLISGFCQIEKRFAQHQTKLLAHVSAAASHQRLANVAVNCRTEAQRGLSAIVRDSTLRHELRKKLDKICDRIDKLPASLGSTDYNARNIVVDDSTTNLTFIEFATIGWDWPERRLVQYAIGLGSKQNGGFISVLDQVNSKQYVNAGTNDPAFRAFALDGHHLLFHLNAAAKLLKALKQPEIKQHKLLLASWRQPNLRLSQLHKALTTPLTEDPSTSDFRKLFGTTVLPKFDTGDKL